MSRTKSGDARHTEAGARFTTLLLEIFRINGRLLVAGDRLTAKLGLTSARWQVLGAVRRGEEPGTVADIARRMGLQRQSVQRVVDLLRDESVVKLVDNPNHRRAKLVMLTPKGSSLLERVDRVQRVWANTVTAGVRPADLDVALKVLEGLRKRLEARPATK